MNITFNQKTYRWMITAECVMAAVGTVFILVHHTSCSWMILSLLLISSALNIWICRKCDLIRRSVLWHAIQMTQTGIFLFLDQQFAVLTFYSGVSVLLECLLFGSTLVCYYGAIIRKWRVETLFLTIAIPYGVFMSLSLPVKSVPDEIAHIYTSYHMADHMLQIEDTDDNSFSIRQQDWVFLSAPIEYENSKELMNEIYKAALAESYESVIEQDAEVCLNGNEVAYVLSAAGIAAGQLLNWNAFWTLNAGRMMNLLQYVLLIYLAIKVMPSLKLVPFTVSLLPMAMQQGMSYSYDSLIIGLSIFTVCGAYGLKRCLSSDRKKSVMYGSLLILSGLVLSSMKSHSYIFVAIVPLIVLLSDNRLFRRILVWILRVMIACVLIFAVYMVVDVLFDIKPLFSVPVNPIAWQDGAQGYTIQYFLNEPFDLLLVYARTVVVYTHFYIRSAISDYLAWLSIRTPLVFVPLFLLFCFAAAREEKTDYINQTEKRYYIVMAMITVASIVMGLLLAWTPVGTGVSLGVQGRYFLPLVVPFFLAFNKGASRFQGCGKYLPAAYALTLMVFSICLITRF